MRRSGKFESMALSRGFSIRTVDERWEPINRRAEWSDNGTRVREFADGLEHTDPDPVVCETCDGWGFPLDEKRSPMRSKGDCKTCSGLGHTFHRDPLLPTDFTPGSWQKSAVLMARRQLGAFLWVEGDRKSAEGLQMPGVMVQIEPEETDECEEDNDDE